MKTFLTKAVISAIVVLLSLSNTAYSLHIAQLRNSPDSVDLSSVNNETISNDAVEVPSVKGNLGSITSLINPTQIINQIQTTVNSFLQTLNSTLNGSASNITSLLGSLKNLTNKSTGTLRLDDVDFVVANISEIVKNSARSEAELVNNSSEEFKSEVHGAFEDFRKSIMELRNSALQQDDSAPAEEDKPLSVMLEEKTVGTEDHASSSIESAGNNSNGKMALSDKPKKPSGLPKTLSQQLSSLRTQVDSRIQRSVSNTRSVLEESVEIARQSSQITRNQTSDFMAEVQRVISEFTLPIRNFFDVMRRGLPTAVVTA